MEARRSCSVHGCKGAVVAKFMCDLHYRRVRDHGHVGPATPDRGTRTKHPLYSTWKGLMRTYRRQCVPAWRDFWRFVDDVQTPPPQPRARFRRTDDAKPFGPGNWFWFEVWAQSPERNQRMREYHRALEAANPRAYLDKYLRRYGVDISWYERQLEQQKGVCAICRQPETLVIRGKVMRLAVDHCKDTGRVRGLLCSKCNQGIGCFVHDGARLLAAVDYLRGT